MYDADRVGHDGADVLAKAAAKAAGPSIGQSKQYLKRQALCKSIQVIQARILEHIQSLESKADCEGGLEGHRHCLGA
eukprot:11651124-Heterocapsa_arctica.AAC.1